MKLATNSTSMYEYNGQSACMDSFSVGATGNWFSQSEAATVEDGWTAAGLVVSARVQRLAQRHSQLVVRFNFGRTNSFLVQI